MHAGRRIRKLRTRKPREDANWAFLTSLAIGLGFFSAEISRWHRVETIEYVLLLGVGFVMLHFAIAWHELGHWAAGRLAGIVCVRLKIGAGPPLARFRLGSLMCDWRLLPSGGFAFPGHSRRFHGLAGSSLFILGGILAELLFIVPLWFVWKVELEDDLLRYGLVAAYVVINGTVLGSLDLLWNFWPHRFRRDSVWRENDGLMLLNLWRRSRWREEDHRLSAVLAEIDAAERAHSPERSATLLAQCLTEFPRRWEVRMRQYHFAVARKDFASAREAAAQGVADPQLSAAGRADVLDTFASHVLTEEVRELVPDAEGWIREAIRLQPKKLTLKGTLGALLAEMDRDDEAREWLAHLAAKSPNLVDRTFSEAMLGWLAAKAGRSDEAVRYFESAARFNLEMPDLPRLRERARKLGVPLPAEAIDPDAKSG